MNVMYSTLAKLHLCCIYSAAEIRKASKNPSCSWIDHPLSLIYP